MKKYIYLLAILLSGLTMSSASAFQKIDLLSQVRLHDSRMSLPLPARINEAFPMHKSAFSAPGVIRAFIELSAGYDFTTLEAEGVEVTRVIGDIVLCVMPIDDVERISDLPCVKKLTIDTPRQLMSHGARAVSNVDAIHAGEGLPTTYTGKGVVCGIYDQGIDPNHINFIDENGETRISILTYLHLNGAGQPVFSDYDRSNVYLFDTDERGTYHGTHTLGIMAGGYRGELTGGYPADYDVESGNPYYGMAPDAELAVMCGITSDYFIANGVANIVDYAQEVEKPAVINLSLGGNIGTHDGNSVMSRFLEMAGQYAIIVMAAGNEGNVPLHASKTFSDDDNEFKTLLKPYYEPEANNNLRYGQVAIYSDDNSMFDVQAVVYNRNTGKIAYRIPLPEPGTGASTYHITSIDFAVSDYDIVSQPLSKYFNGYLGLGSAMDADTGKFYCVIDYYLINNQEKNADDTYVPGFIITGVSGQTVRMWCDGSYTQLDSYGEEGWSDGTTDGTISDMATARNVVVVGSYNTEGTLHNLDGTREPFEPSLGEFAYGEVTSFSAYGTLADGRQLPHICAPGVSLVSSTSRYYVENEDNAVNTDKLSAVLRNGDVNYWWSQTGGTSMATPVVAGAIALWLEADPDLTVEEVIDIIQKTAIRDEQVEFSGTPVQWGAGKFDAYAGLKEVLRNTGINTVEGAGSPVLLTRCGSRSFNVSLPGAPELRLDVYSLAGTHVASFATDDDSCEIDLCRLAAGVYMLCVNGSRREKIVLK